MNEESNLFLPALLVDASLRKNVDFATAVPPMIPFGNGVVGGYNQASKREREQRDAYREYGFNMDIDVERKGRRVRAALL